MREQLSQLLCRQVMHHSLQCKDTSGRLTGSCWLHGYAYDHMQSRVRT